MNLLGTNLEMSFICPILFRHFKHLYSEAKALSSYLKVKTYHKQTSKYLTVVFIATAVKMEKKNQYNCFLLLNFSLGA